MSDYTYLEIAVITACALYLLVASIPIIINMYIQYKSNKDVNDEYCPRCSTYVGLQENYYDCDSCKKKLKGKV